MNKKYNITDILNRVKNQEILDINEIFHYFGLKNESIVLSCKRAVLEWNMTFNNVPPHCMPDLYHPILFLIICIMLTILSFGTCIGNVLMILAFILVKKLRTPCNMLIINLAVTDLLVSILVIPIASVYQIKGYWIFDEIICSGFILFDVLLCTSSILNLCAISVDRYFIITRPFQYAARRTKKRMLLMIAIVWVASALISIPPLFGWSNSKTKYTCDYSENLGYQIYATFIAFYLPLVVMLVLYGRIFRLAHNMVNQDQKTPPVTQNVNNKRRNANIENENQIKEVTNTNNCYLKPIPKIEITISDSENDYEIINKRKSISSKGNSETKAVRTLGVIMGCFTICWLPFFIVQLLTPLFSAFGINMRTAVSEVFFQIFYWLGYTNSFLNPIIYAIFNREFRTPLKQIIKCKCRNIEEVLRIENYSRQYGISEIRSAKSLKDMDTPINRRRSPQRIRANTLTISST